MQAVANLLHATCTALAGIDPSGGHRRALLLTFQRMNEGLISPDVDISTLNAAVRLQEEVLNEIARGTR